MEIIEPENHALKDVYENIKRRSKAIKYRGGLLSCERILERDGDESMEKLEFSYGPKKSVSAPSIRMYVWSDRWVWVDAREASRNGWKWEWTGEGRAPGQDFGRVLTKALERSIDEAITCLGNAPDELEKIWGPLLSDGRLEVVR